MMRKLMMTIAFLALADASMAIAQHVRTLLQD